MKKGLLFLSALSGFCGASLAEKSTNDNPQLGRTPVKEPTYTSTPKYCLLALGLNGDTKVWMVEDGKRLFLDKNANGDLTDDGPPIEPSKERGVGTKQWDFNYVHDAITATDGSRHTDFDLRRWNYGEEQDSYGLSLSVGGKLHAYAGWYGTFWSAKRETAPVIHFGGSFSPCMLRPDEITIGTRPKRFSVGFENPGSGPGAESRLSIEALPPNAVPKVTIEWPTAAGSPPLRTTQPLPERCCYWEFYTTSFKLPDKIVPGKAKVTVDLPTSGTPIVLKTTEFELPVVAPSAASDSKD
jgi:hypothetical protein